MNSLLEYNKAGFEKLVADAGIPKFRAGQLLQWVYEKRAQSFDDMTNLPKDLRAKLAEDYVVRTAEVTDEVVCKDGTRKFLVKWPDGVLTETVLMEYHDRNTVCISTQSGCPVRCTFCASGQNGLQRNLTTGEIVQQVMLADNMLADDKRLSNVVIMGMGEPFANYANTIKAITAINADWGLGIGARHITVSTIGIPDRIIQFAVDCQQVTLAVSLHAPNDALRQELIPWAMKYPLQELMNAIAEYYDLTHREVTIEYVLLDGVNCLPKHAEQLAKLVRPHRCNVNLINYNTVLESGHRPASEKAVANFMDILKQRGVNVHLRQSKGSDINAACGQLRNSRQGS